MTSIINKEQVTKVYHGMIKHLNLFAIAMLIGITIGFKIAGMYFNYRMNEAVLLQGFIHNNIIYEIKAKP